MKTRLSQMRLLFIAGAVSTLPLAQAQEPVTDKPAPAAATVVAQTTASEQAAPATTVTTVNSATTTAAAPAKLPYGAEDVVKLTQAHVSEEVIRTYVQNSGTIYNLGASDIVNLKKEGVSDQVINDMMDQRKRAEATPQPAAPQFVADPAAVGAAPTYVQDPYAQSPVYYPQPAPEPEPAPSTLYVIPYPAATQAYYSTPVYYGGYYGGGYGYGGYGYYGGGYCGSYTRSCYPYRSTVVRIHSGFARHGGHHR